MSAIANDLELSKMHTIEIDAEYRRSEAPAEAADSPRATRSREASGASERPSASPVAAPERPSYCPSRMSAAHAASHLTIGEFLSKFPMAPGVEIDEAAAGAWMDAKEAELGLAPARRQDGARVYHLALLDHRLAHLAAFGA